jgi:hypothetical protein
MGVVQGVVEDMGAQGAVMKGMGAPGVGEAAAAVGETGVVVGAGMAAIGNMHWGILAEDGDV